MHVAIIGAGAAGLAAARQVSDPKNGLTCEVFEQTGQIGGTWVYVDQVGTDENGLPVHSAMYKGLMTNLPKETMGFPDFDIPEQEESYLEQEEILKFLNMYVDHFNLKPLIKFYKYVKSVKPLANNRWEIEIIDAKTKKLEKKYFDAVMICNGHYNSPSIPKIPGQDVFKGQQFHSHSYRSSKPFENKNVVIVGAGPSGMDLALHISYCGKKVLFSHHTEDPIATSYPNNVIEKPDIRCVRENGVEFVDGSYADADIICYCTGYRYNFPFLSEECKITVEDNHIEPLYKHMVNIEHPTMCMIGIPFNVCAFQMFDLQARYYVEYLKGTMSLPNKEDMYKDTADEMQKRWDKGYCKRQAHMMGPDQSNYYDDLAHCAKVKPIAPVIVKLREESGKRLVEDFVHFRKDKYKLLDEQNYIKVN